MAYLDWDESLSVGIPSIDAQHQKLVAIINTLHEAMRARQGKGAVVVALSEMKDYARVHFADEERLLRRCHYPGLQDQIDKHLGFVEKLTEFQVAAEAGELNTTIDVMEFLRDWLIRHIQKSDRAYSQLLRECGVT